ncbi:MAG: ribosome biogenesis GTPase Der [Alphaproteobacteria bacterium]
MIKIAIIGRPNVGKSTLFNRLAGRKLAIVHDKPGVTRDRKFGKAKLKDIELEVIDTPGFEDANDGTTQAKMLDQTKKAIEEAQVCLFLYDARVGIHPYDEHFADMVRQSHKPVILLANKCEGKAQEEGVYEAYKLGLGEPIIFSGEHGVGLADLYMELLKYEETQEEKEQREREDIISIAIVGRPNVGKSTLVNALLKDERMLTGPEAGLTRDAIENDFSYKGQKIKLIDTAGLRRRAKVTDGLEKMSAAATKKAAYLAQVVILVLDSDGILDAQDLKIAREVLEEGRALIIALNKWDVADKQKAIETLNYKLTNSLAQADGIETITISALKKEGLDKLMNSVLSVYKKWNFRIPTAKLNQWFAEMIDNYPPPLGKNKRRIKLKFITQAKTRPPTFFIFSSNPEGLPESYLRYVTNGLRQTFNLYGTPLRVNIRKGKNPYAEDNK